MYEEIQYSIINSLKLFNNALFYRLQMSDLELNKESASVSIRIDPIVPKTPKVLGGTNQETRKAAVQLNIIEDVENVTSEPCCAQNRTKYPKLFQILTFIGQILEWIGNLFGLVFLSIVAIYLFLFFSSTICIGIWVLTWKTTYTQGIGTIILMYTCVPMVLALCVAGLYGLKWVGKLKDFAKNVVLKTFFDFLKLVVKSCLTALSAAPKQITLVQ